MKDYFYACAKKEENGITYLKVPVIVSPETEMVGDQRPRLVSICHRQFPCVFSWIPISYYETHQRDLESQAKAEERSRRCLVPDPQNIGGRIRCPEENKCYHCPFVGKMDFDCGHDTSLDALMEIGYDTKSGFEVEDGYEPSAATATPEDIFMEREAQRKLDEILDQLLDLLAQTDPKECAILAMLRQGETNASKIARHCGLNQKHAAKKVRRIQQKALRVYKELKKC